MRQLKASGLNRRFYAPHVREMVDYDYDDQLPDDARVWLAAFSEEHYRGWRLKSEEQLHSLVDLRAADAARKRTQRALGPDHIQLVSFDEQPGSRAARRERQPLRSDSPTEADLVSAIDRARDRAKRKKR